MSGYLNVVALPFNTPNLLATKDVKMRIEAKYYVKMGCLRVV